MGVYMCISGLSFSLLGFAVLRCPYLGSESSYGPLAVVQRAPEPSHHSRAHRVDTRVRTHLVSDGNERMADMD